jgi:hypothetical protein
MRIRVSEFAFGLGFGFRVSGFGFSLADLVFGGVHAKSAQLLDLTELNPKP